MVETAGNKRETTVIPIEAMQINPGDTIEISQASNQQKLLDLTYKILGLPDEENLKAEGPQTFTAEIAVRISDIFKMDQSCSEVDRVPKKCVNTALSIVEAELSGNADINEEDKSKLEKAKLSLEVLSRMPDSEKLTIVEVVGQGTNGAVVRTEKQNLLKVLFLSGVKASTADRATHMDQISTALRKAPPHISTCLAVPTGFGEATITSNFDTREVRTIIAEIPEAIGTRFSEWEPKNLEEFCAVTKKIAEVVTYLHSKRVVNVDSGDLIVDTEMLAQYLMSPKTAKSSFIRIVDLDEAIIFSLNSSGEVSYPPFLQNKVPFMGKMVLWNPILINRNPKDPITEYPARWVDIHNYMTQFFSKLTGLGSNGQVVNISYKEGGCKFDIDNLSDRINGFLYSADKFYNQSSYPLVFQDEFISKFKSIFGENTVSEEDLESVYWEFQKFFDGYFSQAKLINTNPESKGIGPGSFSERMGKIIDYLEKKTEIGVKEETSSRYTTAPRSMNVVQIFPGATRGQPVLESSKF